MKRAYDEPELVSNRVSVFLLGGSATERRAWADEAQAHFLDEGPLVEAGNDAALLAALKLPRGVVYVPDVALLSGASQFALLCCLQTQEERSKFILGLVRSERAAVDDGSVREDLVYRLATARVDLSVPAMKQAIAARRAARPAPGKSRPSSSGLRHVAKVKR